MVREITLSHASPHDDQLKVELVRVEPSGDVVIYSQATDQSITAKVGQPFLGRQEYVEGVGMVHQPFGSKGLILVSSNPDTQTAVLACRSGETYESWGPFRLSR